jgi:hypothetical protein
MKRFFVCLSIVELVLGMSGLASATVVIDPDTGWSGDFGWDDGLGQIDRIGGDYSETDWSLTLSADSYLTFGTAYDDYVPGDEFALYMDGAEVAWTNTYIDGGGYFHGEITDLLLGVGTHILTIYTTALAPGWLDGAAHAEFSSVEAVPEPSTMLLLGAGLVGLGILKKKRQK